MSLLKISKKFQFMALICVGAVGANSAIANDGSDLPNWLANVLEPVHYGLNETVDATSRSLDRYFGTDESLFVDNRSYLRLAQDAVYIEGRGTQYDTRLRFRIDLPTTRKKLRLVIENDAERLEDGSVDTLTGRPRANSNNLDTGDSSVGLERVSDKNATEHWRTSTGVGLRVNNGFDPYVRASAFRVWPFQDNDWSIQFFNRVSYFKKRGLIFRTNFDVNRKITDSTSFRVRTQAEWERDRNEETFIYHAYEINQLLDQRNALRYAAIFLGDTARDNTVYDRVLQLYYRRDIHKRFVYMDVIPEMHFPRINNLDPYFALTFRLEFFFQANYYDSLKNKGATTNYIPIR